jgi:hypothetical protein
MTKQELQTLKDSLKLLKEQMITIETNTDFLSNQEAKAKQIIQAIETVIYADQYFYLTK